MARATVEQLEARKRELERRIAAAKRHEAEAERKARNHALIIMGTMVERCFPNGWESVDWSELERYFEHYGYAVGRCASEPLDTKGATSRLREWERSHREGEQGGEA
jgi:hypothetical protein